MITQVKSHSVPWTMTVSKVKLVCPKYVEIPVPCKILAEPVPFVGLAIIVPFAFVHKAGPVIHNCVATNVSAFYKFPHLKKT